MTIRRPVATTVMACLLVHAALAAGAYGVLAAAKSRLPGWTGWADKDIVFADVPLYLAKANAVASGKVPYRDVAIEYPILALPFLFAPRLVTAEQRPFVLLFALEMLLVHGATLLLVVRWIDRQEGWREVVGRLVWYSACIAALGPFLLGRYDAVPAFLAFASACAWFSQRPARGGLLAGLGFLVKVAPGVIVLPGMIFELMRRGKIRVRGVAGFAATVAVGLVAWWALAGAGMAESIRYHSERGLEIESVPAGVAFLLANRAGTPMASAFDHGSRGITTSLTDRMASWMMPAQLASLGLVGALFAWRRATEPMRHAAAAMLVFAAGGKVLSPQYLLWTLPFFAAIPGRVGVGARPLMAAACLLTAVVCPWCFGGLVNLELGPFVVLNARNMLLAGILGWLLLAARDPVASAGS